VWKGRGGEECGVRLGRRGVERGEEQA